MKLYAATIAVATSSSSSSCSAFMTAPLGRKNRAAVLNAKSRDGMHDEAVTTRRRAMESLFVGATAAIGFFATPQKAEAFSNKVSSQFDNDLKQPGELPKDLGVAMRKDMAGGEYLGLKECGAAPNCFCSTDKIEESPDTNIPTFKWPTQLSSQEEAFQQLYEVVKAYKPGQNNIDGGGFDIVTFDPKAGYMYVQFESSKFGFIDDFELAVVGNKGNNEVQIRSSSRLGYLDFGVNAKRINYIAKALKAKGWDAAGVEIATHMGYAEENNVKSF